MSPDVLNAQIDKTLIAMKAQTGKEPGQPTGLCHSVVVGALTGGDIIFSETRTGKEQIQLERQHGLFLHPVYVRPPSTHWSILPELLEQTVIGIETIVIFDRAKTFNRNHVNAIVPDNGSSYHIVDSLLPRARTHLSTSHAVSDYMDKRFTGEQTDVYVSLSTHERKRRGGVKTIMIVGDDIFVTVPRI